MSTISASTTTTTAFKVTSDTTGTLVLQTGSTPTTAVTIDTSGNFGIGTSSPATKFQISATGNPELNISGTAGSPALSFISNASGAGIIAYSQYLRFGTVTGTGLAGYADQMTILANGNLGIGTSSPSSRLNVDGGSLATSGVGILAAGSISTGRLISGGGTTVNAVHTYYDDRAYELSAGSTSGYVSGIAIGARSYSGTGGDAVTIWTRSAERARIDSSGNLGLGVTPSAWTDYKVLQMSGNSAVYALGSNEIGTVQNAYYNAGWKYGVSSVAASWNYVYQGATYWKQAASGTAGNAITFTQAMTLDVNGNLLVGTTSGVGKVRIQGGAGTTPALYAYNTNATSGDYAAVFALGANNNNTSSFFLNCTEPGVANRFAIYGNGTYATLSDQRLKKNVETARNGYLDDVVKLRVVKYNWNSQADGEAKELGVIAQELEQVFPGLIQESKAEDADTSYKQIKTSVLPFILLKAIQELKAEFDAYKASHP